MRHLELSRDVRAEFQYSNLCYNVAGLLIERLSGQSYEAFIRARLADRLGMTVGFSLNDPADRVALDTLARLFPDREVVGIHAVDLVWGLGTLHCLTQQQPSGTGGKR